MYLSHLELYLPSPTSYLLLQEKDFTQNVKIPTGDITRRVLKLW